MQKIATDRHDGAFQNFLKTYVVFLNSIVDRITSTRQDSHGMVPRCEPMPKKALILLDAHCDLTPKFKNIPGVIVRTTSDELETDKALKLRISYGALTAVAHGLALQQYLQTTIVATDDPGKIYMAYLESLVNDQIIPAASMYVATTKEAQEVWEED